eukprot:3515666-Prymnesium_polylepis.1
MIGREDTVRLEARPSPPRRRARRSTPPLRRRSRARDGWRAHPRHDTHREGRALHVRASDEDAGAAAPCDGRRPRDRVRAVVV